MQFKKNQFMYTANARDLNARKYGDANKNFLKFIYTNRKPQRLNDTENHKWTFLCFSCILLRADESIRPNAATHGQRQKRTEKNAGKND